MHFNCRSITSILVGYILYKDKYYNFLRFYLDLNNINKLGMLIIYGLSS